jgi:hypothetical protein
MSIFLIFIKIEESQNLEYILASEKRNAAPILGFEAAFKIL